MEVLLNLAHKALIMGFTTAIYTNPAIIKYSGVYSIPEMTTKLLCAQKNQRVILGLLHWVLLWQHKAAQLVVGEARGNAEVGGEGELCCCFGQGTPGKYHCFTALTLHSLDGNCEYVSKRSLMSSACSCGGLAGHYWQLVDPSHQQHLIQPQQGAKLGLAEALLKFGSKVSSMVLFPQVRVGAGGCSWGLCWKASDKSLWG